MNDFRLASFSFIGRLLAACGFAVLLAPGVADAVDGSCSDNVGVILWTSPRAPRPDVPLKIMAVSIDAPLHALTATGPDGSPVPLAAVNRGGPPWSVSAVIEQPRPGAYRLAAVRDGLDAACRTLQVGGKGNAGGQARPARGWDASTEAFYSAWIEQLFDAPLDADMSFPTLEPVLRDPARNFLHNHFGAGEDGKFSATPDCADLPYFLRTYFAWKVGLPVSHRACGRGTASSPPRCGQPTVHNDFLAYPASLATFKTVITQVNNGVHSGSARTGLRDDATDFYPLPLRREALWPGTVYADPYGHTLMIAKWIPQTADQPGLLLAMDAQPDNSVARKRFWEGTFLFADDVASAGPGFKAFRPLTAPGNAALADSYPRPYSDEQAELSRDEFYARMGKLIDPAGLDPRQAYDAMLDALVEQLNTRVESVNNGERYMQSHPGAVAEMPQGAAIFETIGPWEDYSTPSRDMRLIIAMNVLESLPERIVRHPDLFLLKNRPPQEVKREIEQLHTQRIQERTIAYTRSDGSPWQLSVAEVFARKAAFEMSYNPNDCAEFRWGAQPGTAEYAPCRRHAPSAQHARMEQYRSWFHEARRPSR